MTEGQIDQLRQKLKSWVDEIGNEIGSLLTGRKIFQRLQEIVNSNEKIQSPHIFHDWVADNYVAKMCSCVRALAENNPRNKPVSLYMLIEKIKKNPHAITRDYFISQSRDDFAKEMGTAGNDFDTFAKPGEQYIDSKRLDSDLQKLAEGTRLIGDFTDQWIAHFDQKPKIERMPTFEDLNKALDIIDEVWCDYYLLLTCHGLGSGTRQPVIAEDWEAPLRYPWIVEQE